MVKIMNEIIFYGECSVKAQIAGVLPQKLYFFCL